MDTYQHLLRYVFLADGAAVETQVELERALHAALALGRPEEEIATLLALFDEANTLALRVRAAQVQKFSAAEKGA